MKKLSLLAGMSMLAFSVNAQNIFPSSGNVGIGTTSPTNLFHIYGSGQTADVRIGGGNGSGNGRIFIQADFANNLSYIDSYGDDTYKYLAINASPLVLNKSTGGNVGIGTDNPDRKLTINANSGLNVRSSTGYFINMNYLYGSTIPAIYALGPGGGVSNLTISPEGGFVGIGTITPTEKLSVNGTIRSKEVKVETTNWPDYVFEEGYKVEKLEELESFIKTNKHLPGIPSAKEVEKEGISLGEMNAKLLQKIEEMTLQMIEMNKQVKEQGAKIKDLEQQLNSQKK